MYCVDICYFGIRYILLTIYRLCNDFPDFFFFALGSIVFFFFFFFFFFLKSIIFCVRPHVDFFLFSLFIFLVSVGACIYFISFLFLVDSYLHLKFFVILFIYNYLLSGSVHQMGHQSRKIAPQGKIFWPFCYWIVFDVNYDVYFWNDEVRPWIYSPESKSNIIMHFV